MALKYFKKHGVDAVLHLGDITDCGMVRETARIWGEPHDNVWHKEVKGYHFFGFDWPRWTGEDMNEATPDHPLKVENYVKVIGAPEFPRGAKLEVAKANDGALPHLHLYMAITPQKTRGRPCQSESD